MMNMFHLQAFLLIVIIFALVSVITADESSPVTCGSGIKLIHKETKFHLHSHAIAWGSGSGQQSVTASGTQADPNSIWVVKEPIKISQTCELSKPILCGSMISLEHAGTGKHLHSHLFRSMISGNQEVSGFGPDNDTGDNWIVECESKEKYWIRGAPVSFRHVDTSKYLSTGEVFKFTTQNCGHQCPIMGQTEVSAARKDAKSLWVTGQGIYFSPKSVKDPSTGEL